MSSSVITGKIILKSATKLSLDRRFSEIAKQTPVLAQASSRFQQQANVTIPYSREELFAAKRANEQERRQDLFMRNRPAAMDVAARLKKRSISYRLSQGNNNFGAPSRIFQRVGLGNGGIGGRRRQVGTGASPYLFGGQSGMGVRLRGQGRVQSRMGVRGRRGGSQGVTRGVARFGGQNNVNNRFQNGGVRRNGVIRGSRAGGRGGALNRTNSNRGGSTRGGARGGRGGGGAKVQQDSSLNKQVLDEDLEKYMAQTKLDGDFDMNTV